MNREKRFPPFLAFLALALFVKHKARYHTHHHGHHRFHSWKHRCHRWHWDNRHKESDTSGEFV